MAKYTIIRIYEVPASNKHEAIDRFQEALVLHEEKDYLVKDILREPGAKAGTGIKIDLKPPQGWFGQLKKQLLG